MISFLKYKVRELKCSIVYGFATKWEGRCAELFNHSRTEISRHRLMCQIFSTANFDTRFVAFLVSGNF